MGAGEEKQDRERGDPRMRRQHWEQADRGEAVLPGNAAFQEQTGHPSPGTASP